MLRGLVNPARILALELTLREHFAPAVKKATTREQYPFCGSN